MANKLPDIFSRTDAKSRIILVIVTVVVVSVLIYAAARFFGGGPKIASAKVANAPSNLQSVPGGQLTPEYYRALMQSNAQTARQAQISGGSAVPTLVNVPGQAAAPSGNCAAACPGGVAADVTQDLNDLVASGKLPQDDANRLLDMAKNNVSVDQYADQLDSLVKQGKLTPEQARKLLEEYTAQHANATAAEGAKAMDALIKSGQLPLAAANDLLALQKQGVTPEQYAQELNRLVAEGKISPAVAQQLLAQYTQQKALEAAKKGIDKLQDMVRSGEITQEVADNLAGLQKRGVSATEYNAELQKLVAEGKISPETAAKLLAQYKAQRTSLGPAAALNDMVSNAAADAAADVTTDLNKMVADGKISKETAATLADLQSRHVSPAEYQAALDALVKAGKLSPEDAKKLMANYVLSDLQKKQVSPAEYKKALDELVRTGKISPQEAARLMAKYQKLQNLREESQRLAKLQANNASVADYANELKRAVAAGILTPEQAAEMLQQYQAFQAGGLQALGVEGTAPGASEFAKLQQRLAQQQAQTATTVTAGAPPPETPQEAQAAAAQAQAQVQAMSDAEARRQEHIKTLMVAMSSQAQSLVASWQTVPLKHAGNSAPEEKKKGEAGGPAGEPGKGGEAGAGKGGTTDKIPLIKAGAIEFAVLDTAVNSDYPDTPVMATLVSGKFKGARVIGKLALTQGQDRVTLNFTSMDKEEWPKAKSVNAYAIDPDTAHTVLASSVDYHYLLRYGSMMGTAFLTGYASAISSSGATTTTGIFGTSTVHPQLSPSNKLAVGLGQIGTTVGNAVAGYVNTPNTVKVDAGVGIGVLFVAEVTE